MRIDTMYIDYDKDEDITTLDIHAITMEHEYDFQNVEILEKEINYKKQVIKDIIHTKPDISSIEDRNDIKNNGVCQITIILLKTSPKCVKVLNILFSRICRFLCS
ncbi:hypothetical protein Trydic_g9684 [Trypoxylus dichotomus]